MSKADLYLEYWTAKMPAVIAGLQANAPIDITDITEKASDRSYGVTFKIANQKFYTVGNDEEKEKAPRTYVRYFFDVFKDTDYFKEHLATKTLLIKISQRARNENVLIKLTIKVEETTESPDNKHKSLDEYIELYKKLISNQLPELGYSEIYKWETVQHFQNNWTDDHNANNIAQILKKSFNKESNNLWSGLNFFPFAMLLGFAERDGATVSSMFKNLYDEKIPLTERFEYFYTKSDELLKVRFPQGDKVHYQSDRVLILYLALRYPDKYYLYKSKMFRTFCELTKYWEFPKVKKGDTIGKVHSYTEMCETLRPTLEADHELMAMHKARLPEAVTFHDTDHLLTQDFIYSVTSYLNKDLPMDDSEKYFLDVLNSYSKEHATFYFNTLDKILPHLNITGPDKRITFSCKSSQLSFIIGHRYGFVLLKEQGNTLYGTMTSKSLGALAVPFGNGSPLFYSKLTIPEVTQHLHDAQAACTSQLNRIDQSRDAANNNLYFEKAVFDKAYRNKILNTPGDMNKSTNNLNQIFFGPPGTGKTYHTVDEAVKIADPEFFKANEHNRDKLKERFRELLIKDRDNPTGQIAFCTFHQSFSYEDFIEGIKPLVTEDKRVYYQVTEGIFKFICRLARDSRKSKEIKKDRLLSWTEEDFRRASFYKLSLGDITNEEENEVYDYSIRNNCIAMGFGGGYDFTGLDEQQLVAKGKELQITDFGIRCLNLFSNYMKVGNYVIISKGNRYVRAIAKITGPYKFDANAPVGYHNTRAVEWIVKDEDIPVADVYDRNLTQQTIYKISESGIKRDFFVQGGQVANVQEAVKDKNYVLVIDEINRGNVSSIFGELITLIEKDKRAGGDEELEVTLPYSKEPFKVPDNVYIIGTMNTADRSIEALDTALRRRFSFHEMSSKSELIRTEGKLKPTGKIGDVDVVQMLQKINERIGKLIDKDHKIGHAYFMDIKTADDLKLAFKDKVIPLLEEYFFGDFGKIGLVLGNSFVEKANDDFTFASFSGYDEAVTDDLKERTVFRIKQSTEWNFTSIYE